MIKNTLIAAMFGLITWLFLGYQAIDKENTLVIGGPFEFTSQDLSKDGYIYARMQVAESLFEVQPHGALKPKLATSWRVSEDGLQWTFPIRSDVNFHNGERLTADSIIFSLTHAMTKPGVLNQVPFKRVYSHDNQVVVELLEPYRPLVSVLAHYSAAILAPSSFDDEGNVVDILGTGPYRASVIAPPHKLNVRRFEGYWGAVPMIEEVHYLTGHRAESRALQAQSGQADLIYTLDPASIDLLQASDNLDVHSESIPRTVLLKFNNEHRFLNNKETRQAISLAIDREGISNHIVRVPGSEAYQLFPPSLADWHLDYEDTPQRNLEKSRLLLEQQGWNLNSEQILERDGERFALKLVTYADRPELTVISTAIQAQLRELGIDIDVSVDNSSAIPAGHHDGSLEIALVARNYGTISDPLAILMDDTKSFKGSDWGQMNWSSKDLDTTLHNMMLSDDEGYKPLAQEAAKILADEMPLIPVVFYTQQVSINKRVQNFKFDPFENNYRVSEMYFAQ
ncbi:ABC transporter substrate-binding protein [Vibrio superstes]|uniref:ABC transporter substrate-binding protein n=1 Tax=Vibrio superstes NBRC 103154 TaxID=1219062 RepID=A0A511QSZ0_9VIBR|nr:ABC transporter substrate-binding protein [Vibrio superstes]GEM80469.1 ABC transporter substrate-binding protein [Vibrio superstes NBRC 103154]